MFKSNFQYFVEIMPDIYYYCIVNVILKVIIKTWHWFTVISFKEYMLIKILYSCTNL